MADISTFQGLEAAESQNYRDPDTLKAEAEAKTAGAKAASIRKIITITCMKGKLTKKVIAVKPVCPKGYKKSDYLCI